MVLRRKARSLDAFDQRQSLPLLKLKDSEQTLNEVPKIVQIFMVQNVIFFNQISPSELIQSHAFSHLYNLNLSHVFVILIY